MIELELEQLGQNIGDQQTKIIEFFSKILDSIEVLQGIQKSQYAPNNEQI